MSKVPCGGFKLDENFLSMNENDELSLTGGGSEGKAYQYLVTDGNGNTQWEDRLAYESITEKNLIDNTSVTVDRDSGASENISCDWELIVGEKYTVRDNGHVVEGIVAQEGSGYKLLVIEDGNAYLYQYPGYWKYTSRANGLHTLTLSGPSASVKTIDPKYIPSELNEVILPSSTSGSTKKFKITVDDSGNITATQV